ncbi:MAG: hypothetical protein OXP36_07070 [Gammaproteobacteria bacterium]|nr:hypothetical protein [Gammaproteobacteria bacterium]
MRPCSASCECISGKALRHRREAAVMVASIGKIASPSQGVGYFEKEASA